MKKPFQEVAYFYNSMKDYREFIEYSERLWPEELKRYEISINDENEEYGSRFNYRRDLSNVLSTEYPQLQRKSYIIMLLALFEDFLNQLCYSLQVHENINEGLGDVQGKGIDRAKNYITKHTSVSFPSSGSEWQHIKDAQSIHNVVVHAAGYMNLGKHKKQLNIVASSNELEKIDYARTHLMISYKALFDLVDVIEMLCKKLMAELEVSS
ncbi:MAG: hypothetical protein ACKVJE_06000 [Pseudomonadales bacterium]